MQLSELPAFTIAGCSIWSPIASGIEECMPDRANFGAVFKAGDLPSASFLPVSLRKKLSPLTKVSCFLLNDLIVRLNLDATKIRFVFSSRYGEADNTIQLSRAIRDEEPSSPMAFSRSVHNSALGVFSIASSNYTLSSSVAGGSRSVSAGLTEAVIQLYSSSEMDEVLYVHADEKMPDEFHQFVSKPEVAFGFVCLLKKSETKIEFSFSEEVAASEDGEVLEFMDYLLSLHC